MGKIPTVFIPPDSHRPVSIPTYRSSQVGDVPGVPETVIKSSDMKLHAQACKTRWKEGVRSKSGTPFPSLGKRAKGGSSICSFLLFLLFPTPSKRFQFQNSFQHKLHPMCPEIADFYRASCRWNKSAHLALRAKYRTTGA